MSLEELNSSNFFSKSRIHVLLFIATFLTTYYVNGLWYSITIMTILLSHELGHFFMCRKYHVAATMPYFLPLPFPPFGTFGAVIKMKGIIPDKKALFDIGAAGPLMGLFFAMTDIILESGGTLDKYEGDAIIAFWGAPLPLENHARSACLAAIDNQKKLAELCKVFADEGIPQINCRIGISSGEMVVGNMGSLQRFDYTVMGDAVNLGQRLEVSNKLYDTHILISERTCELARESIEVRELDLLYVKGKEKPVRVFELLGRKGEAGEKMR